MADKPLKVLISAFACRPNQGSEPEVGWQWAMQMSLYHDVTVLTRAINRVPIEKALEPLRGKRPLPRFVYHDEGPFLFWIWQRFKAIRFYYIFWQLSAWAIIDRLNRETPFDLMHHVTFAGFRYNTAIWNHGVPTVWGPVGGILSIPWRLLPWKYPRSFAFEVFRHINNFIQSAPFHFLPRRAQMTTVTLASTEEMEQVFYRLGLEATLMPTIGLHARNTPEPARRVHDGPLKVLFVGSVITLKGIDLAIHAMAEARTNATFTIVGDGDFLVIARKLIRKLGIESQVEFCGRLPLQQTLTYYPNFDLFLFPSLHDTGGFALIEAMSCGLPVICLDCGGPRLAVKEGAGIKVPLGSRKAVLSGLAEAIRRYDKDRKLLAEHGLAARQVILREYDWEIKGRELDAIYHRAVAEWHAASTQAAKPVKLDLKNIFNRLFPIRGLAVSALILFIIGTAGFLSVDRLKRNAELIVTDTLPGISDAGAANSSLAGAFNRTLLVLMSETPEERAAYRKELDDFSQQTSALLAVIENTKSTREEQVMYNEVMERRQKYHAAREHVLDLVDHQRKDEALRACQDSMLPAYLEYKKSAETLLKYNASRGKSRGETIMKISLITQCVVVGIGVALFVTGFLIGLFK